MPGILHPATTAAKTAAAMATETATTTGTTHAHKQYGHATVDKDERLGFGLCNNITLQYSGYM